MRSRRLSLLWAICIGLVLQGWLPLVFELSGCETCTLVAIFQVRWPSLGPTAGYCSSAAPHLHTNHWATDKYNMLYSFDRRILADG